MDLQTRKLNFIEKVISIENPDKIFQLEKVLQTPEKHQTKTLKDFMGIISDKEADKLEKAINDGCGTIDYEGWK